jgi:hypothetical protein
MKKVFFVAFIIFAYIPGFAQNDLIDRITRQAIEIDSLKKVAEVETDKKQLLSKEYQNLQDTLKYLRSVLAKLEEFRTNKREIDNLLQRKTDSIGLYKVTILEKDKQIAIEKQTGEQKAIEQNEKGKNEILATLINGYKNKTFDELLKSSSKQTVQRDLLLIQNPAEVKQLLNDIDTYFDAKESLSTKLDVVQIKSVLSQLQQIKQHSVSISKLKEVIENYPTYNDGLKETFGKLVALDQSKAVSGMSKEVQKKKLDVIFSELSLFIFNYDFNFSDYPYLSNIFVELVNRKVSNADADISDLSNKL